MEIIFWSSMGLLIIAGIAIGHTVRKHNKMFGDEEDPVPFDDAPVFYEDVAYSEKPFIEYFN